MSCEQFNRRIARYLIELGVEENVRRNVRYVIEFEICKEFAWRNARYSIELVVVRRMLECCDVRCLFKLGVVMEFVRSIQRYSIELSCEEFRRRIAR